MLDCFNRNNLSKEELQNVEVALLRNKIANASFSLLFNEYQTRSDIDELIGNDEDDFYYKKTDEKIVSKK